MTLTAVQVARYLAKVDQRGTADCWPWTGAKSGPEGDRPHIRIQNRTYIATRIGWLITHGVFPDHDVCHTCDVPDCMNPAHWFDGTHDENMADAAKKGRMASKANGRWTPRQVKPPAKAKLTAEQVLAIRASTAPYVLGKSFGITKGTVLGILKRETWKHLDGPVAWKVVAREDCRGALHASKRSLTATKPFATIKMTKGKG